MADFVLLYRGGSSGETEEERAAQMEAWTSWFGSIGPSVKDGGNPFAERAAHVATDGAITTLAADRMASGYSILQADSLDAAVTLAKGCPVLTDGGAIEVYEVFPAM